jgi:superfamily II DNA/RNA helicase
MTKTRKLIDLLNKLEFHQVAIFVKSVSRCTALCKLLTEKSFSAIEIHHEIPREKRFLYF